MQIRIVIEKDEDGWYVATVPSFPGCISQGKTKEEAEKNIKEAVALHIKLLIEDGIPITKISGKKIEELVEVKL